MGWTDERIELLKRRWSEGNSASQIAAELGGVTRNAVIGKVHRLKLESRIKAPQAVGAAALAAVTSVKAKPVAEPRIVEAPMAIAAAPRVVSSQPSLRPVLHSVGATALKMDPVADAVADVEPQARASAEIVPIARNLTLVQLSERTCKWPLGDPLSADFRFCGNHAGDASPYCKYHARIAFQPVSERRRVR